MIGFAMSFPTVNLGLTSIGRKWLAVAKGRGQPQRRGYSREKRGLKIILLFHVGIAFHIGS